MAAQGFIVALIVAACSAYAVWTLMPAALRRAIALRALRLSLPSLLARPFVKAAGPTSGCGGCGSCGDAATRPAAAQTVKFHPRPPSR
jgi:ferrous iron transport protein B